MATQYRLRSSAWSLPPTVVAFRGREGVSEIYRFDVGVVWTTSLLDAAAPFEPELAVGEPVTLEIAREGFATHTWNGVIEEVTLVLEEGGSSYWLVSFGPRLRRLAFTEHSRIFTDVAVDAIIEAVLVDEGLPQKAFAMGLTTPLEPREHVSQFRESSLDFVRRLAERDGIYWIFEHGEEEERLRFVDDSRSAEVAVESVRYVAMSSDDAVAGEALGHFRSRRSALPRSMRLHDYDPMRPRLAVTGKTDVVDGPGGDVVRWGENVRSPEEAAHYARLRSEELASRRDVFEGHGVVVGLRPGTLFNLVEHPTLEGAYFTTALRHRGRVGNQSITVLRALGLEELVDLKTQYRVDVTAVSSKVRWRPPSTTPWPRVSGVVTAFVDGAGSSPYAQIDDEGRYRVRIHYDEGDTADGSRSTWVRMLQPHGGVPEGQHFPLRKGTEVAIIFLGGDPDRPFILGVSPNPEKPSPVTRSNHTLNVIQTGSNNRIEMEDIAGGQYITWSTPTANSYLHLGAGPKNFVLKTDGRGRIYTKKNFDVDVDKSKTEDVEKAVVEIYKNTQTLNVKGAVTERLNTSLKWDIEGPVTHTWKGPLEETIDGHVKETFEAKLTTTVNKAITTLTYSGGLEVTVAGDVIEKFTASQETTVKGPLVLLVGQPVTEQFKSGDRHIKGTYYLGVGGTYKIDTPNMILQAPQWSFLSNMAKKLAATKIEKGILARPVFQLNNSGKAALSVSVTVASTSATGLSFGYSSTSKSKTVSEKKAVGAKMDTDGARVDKFMILIVSGGPKVS